ncbi:hypothetical protein [Pseudomonas chlororaphis]|uniref:hypothetical protein n=1 Tax=Pseudomonas chlororaphis TaxID=587753 RepID=UPI0023680902|nr:hypothetical protein [Pseudomonas chlororaphis]WDG45648.1 hypothetical protein PUP58_17950 [Pseudomonas chlororaphis]
MTKIIETVHCRVERFHLTQAEIIQALKMKYGEDPAFKEGRLISVCCSTIFPAGPEGHETEVVFETKLD